MSLVSYVIMYVLLFPPDCHLGRENVVSGMSSTCSILNSPVTIKKCCFIGCLFLIDCVPPTSSHFSSSNNPPLFTKSIKQSALCNRVQKTWRQCPVRRHVMDTSWSRHPSWSFSPADRHWSRYHVEPLPAPPPPLLSTVRSHPTRQCTLPKT